MGRDNGTYEDSAIKKILSPYADDRSAITDCRKLATMVAAIVTSEQGVLVGRRNDGRPPWTFIAGQIEPDESPAAAAIREVKEEAGVQVVAEQEIGHRLNPATGRTIIYIAARPIHGTGISLADRDELAEVRWVSLAEAEDLMEPYRSRPGLG